MKFLIRKASEDNYKEVREINTLDDLKQVDERIIVEFYADKYDKETYGEDICGTVIIYDYYVE